MTYKELIESNSLPNGKTLFYYSIYFKEKDVIKCIVDDRYISCLGFIGDTISTILNGSAECTGFLTSDIRDRSADDFSNVTDVILRLPHFNDNMIVEFERICHNWGVEYTIIDKENEFFVEFPIKSFTRTKWKVQGIIQIMRILYLGHHYIRCVGNSEGLLYQCSLLGFDNLKQSMIYSLSHFIVDDKKSYIKNTDPVYKTLGMAAYSQEIGIMSLIDKLYRQYVLKN